LNKEEDKKKKKKTKSEEARRADQALGGEYLTFNN
jgi:hypothetical protein